MSPKSPAFLSIFILICAATAVVRAASEGRQLSNDETTITTLEHEWVNAAARNDAEAYGRILADDFIGNWADGSKTTKPEEIQMMRSGQLNYGKNEIVEMSLRIFGITAIASGRNKETSVINGKNATGVYTFTDVFLKRNGVWQIVASQTARPVPYGTNCTDGNEHP